MSETNLLKCKCTHCDHCPKPGVVWSDGPTICGECTRGLHFKKPEWEFHKTVKFIPDFEFVEINRGDS